MADQKRQQRIQCAKVQAYDAAVNAMWPVALRYAGGDAENGKIQPEAVTMVADSYMQEFKEMIGERPEYPPVPKSLKI